MSRAVCAAALAALIACGGSARVAGPKKTASASPRSLVVLYGDAVEVRVRVAVSGSQSRPLELPPGERYTLRPVAGEVSGAQVVGPLPAVSFDGLENSRVIARAASKEVIGVISQITDTQVVVRTEDGVEPLPLPVELEIDAPADLSAAVELRSRGGRGELEISSWLGQLRWRIGYTAVLAGGRAEIQGMVSLANNSDHAIAAESIAASIAAAEIGGKPAALLIDRPLSLEAGEAIDLPLFAAPISVPAAVVLVFDPVGDRLDHEGRRPVSRPGYGASRGSDPSPAAVALEVELDALGRLPGGTISVFRRAGGRLVPVGSGVGFADPAPSSATLELGAAPRTDSGRGRVVVARSSDVSGRRWQEELSYDPQRRRLIEEIRVELTNRGDRPAAVDVREHPYRGLNWAVVYNNEAGALRKTAPQEIRFDVEIPARSTKLVVYRVAYTW